jgi:O-methyltransferase domain/Dimerisation domain
MASSRRFAGRCRDDHQTMMPKSAPTEPAATAGRQLTEAILGFVVSQAVYVAAVLGIADLLVTGPRSVTWLAMTVGADPDGLYRLLRLLAGHGIFTELPGGRFANSTPSQLLREDRPGSLRPLAVSVGEGAYPVLGAARRMVQTGEPAFEIVFGAVWEERLARDPAARTRFNRLAAGADQAAAEVLAEQPWDGGECVVGVGAGSGALVQAVLARRPGLRGVIFDLPELVAEADKQVAAAGLGDRCHTVAGSFFRGVPAGGDVYVLAYVLHAWEDPCAREILGAVRRVVPGHGRLLVVEEVLAPPNQPGGKVQDLLIAAVGGRERTEEEWRVLLGKAGFRLTRIRPAHSGSILEAAPS